MEDETQLYEDLGDPDESGSAQDPEGHQTTLIEFGAVETEPLGAAGEAGAEAPHEHGELTGYLASSADTMDAFNEAAGAAIGELVGSTVLAPLGPVGHELGEIVGEAVGEGLQDVWHAAAEAVSDYVESQHTEGYEAQEVSGPGYQTTLEDFGLQQSPDGDAAEQAGAAEIGTDGHQASLSEFDNGASGSDGHDLQLPDSPDLDLPSIADFHGTDSHSADTMPDGGAASESLSDAVGYSDAPDFSGESSVSDVFASLADGDSSLGPNHSDVPDSQEIDSHGDVFATLAAEHSDSPGASYQDPEAGSYGADFGGVLATDPVTGSSSDDVFAQLGADSFDSSGDYGWTDDTWDAGDLGASATHDTGWDSGVMLPDTGDESWHGDGGWDSADGGWESGSDGGAWDSPDGGWDSGGGYA